METDSAGTADSTHGESGNRAYLFVVMLLFLVSGLTSLIYQVVWLRMLVLVFGATSLATSSVLAIFMGGLALGAYISGRFADKISRPLRVYGLLEAAIGLWALLSPLLFAASIPLYQFVWQNFETNQLSTALLRLVVAATILLPPTACMGATLPILSRFVTGSLKVVGKRVGALYAINTGGAVLGSVCSGFFLLPSFGMTGTTAIASVCNIALCIVALAVSGKRETQAPAEPDVASKGQKHQGRASINANENANEPVNDSQESKATTKQLLTAKFIMIAFMVSGAVAMIYEVAWTRALLLVIGSGTYAFTIMLSCFLAGIFIGGLVFSRFIDRSPRPGFWFAMLQVAAALATVGGVQIFAQLPYWNLVLGHWWQGDSAFWGVRLALCACVLMPVTFCLGAMFPAAVKSCSLELNKLGRTVDNLYAANTVGAISGALIGGFVLLPSLGSEQTLIAGAFTNAMLGLVIGALTLDVSKSRSSNYRLARARQGIAASVAIATAALSWYFLSKQCWDDLVLSDAQSIRRAMELDQPLELESNEKWVAEIHARYDLLFNADGLASHVAVMKSKDSNIISLSTNGHIDASDDTDMHVQVMLGALPLLIHPKPENVAVVGWGSGVTVGSATSFEEVKNITAIELEPKVIAASPYFHHVNHAAENNPRVKIEYNDGRNYLLATNKKFDIIASEPSNPWQAGVCNLFTREFFEICKKRLNQGGLFSFWLQTCEISPKNVKEVLSALQEVFPESIVFSPCAGNLVVIASDSPIILDYDRLLKLQQQPSIARELSTITVATVEDLLARFAAAGTLSSIAKGAAPNTDDSNKLEYEVARHYEDAYFIEENMQLVFEQCGPLWDYVKFGNRSDSEKAAIMNKISKLSYDYGYTRLGKAWAAACYDKYKDVEALRLSALYLAREQRLDEAEKLWAQALTKRPGFVELLTDRAQLRNYQGNREAALHDLEEILRLAPANKIAHYLLARLEGPPLGMSQPKTDWNAAEVLKHVEKLCSDSEFVAQKPEVLFFAAEAKLKLGDHAEAKKLIRRFIDIVPNSSAATRFLGSIEYIYGNRAQAANDWFVSFIHGKQYASKLFREGSDEAQRNLNQQAIWSFTRALELDPGNGAARAKLKELKAKATRPGDKGQAQR